MALSLNDIAASDKDTQTTPRQRQRKVTTTAPSELAAEPSLPWRRPAGEKRESQRTAQGRKFNRSLQSEVPVTDVVNNDDLVNIDWKMPSLELLQEVRQSSYTLSRLELVQSWVKSIEVYPKVRIPIPGFLSRRDD